TTAGEDEKGGARVMRGKAHVYPKARITTDEIIPAVHATTDDEARLAERALEPLDPGFATRVRKGDIVVAGEEFGCGSAREHAVWALRGAKVAAVVAKSFAGTFFRNALNNGFLAIECAAAVERTESGDLLEIDLKDGVVRNLTRGESHTFVPLTPFALEILEAGGLLPYVLRQTTGASSA
ncbi:MAG TPA: 3-isopropylmalate dehydratase, partial [Candidatus Polarisedimenticolia bacterium]|nr:3-isopropylmalate dehydratase [Candidatus Polarisedimenticolia bacterium]